MVFTETIRRKRLASLSLTCVLILAFSIPALAGSYEQTNLVSDISGISRFTDPSTCGGNPCLVNPWGMAFSPTSFIWVADNGTGVSTLYTGKGVRQSLVVTIPPPGTPAGSCPAPESGTAAPTGLVFNGSKNFVIGSGDHTGPGLFIFASEDGTISAWSPAVNLTCAVLVVDNSANPSADQHAVYKGLAIARNDAGDSFLYATNFRAGVVERYDKNFQPAGTFTDPTVPEGFAPFGIETIRGQIFVTFAKQDDQKHDDVAGPGNGFVDVFDINGNFLRRFASQGRLNSPWGLALAPDGFGQFSHRVIVGNFGDGHINAFDLNTGASLGPLKDHHGIPLFIGGVWALKFGAGGANNGPVNTLFFTAGIGGESHGLFGTITVFNCSQGD